MCVSATAVELPHVRAQTQRRAESEEEERGEEASIHLFALQTHQLKDFPPTFCLRVLSCCCFFFSILHFIIITGMNSFPVCVVSMSAWEPPCPRGRI